MTTHRLLLFVLISSSMSLQAQNPLPTQAVERASGAVDARIKALEERIIALEGQVRVLKSQQVAQAAAPAPAPVAPAPSAPAPTVQVEAAPSAGPLPVYGGASAAAKALNPDISAMATSSPPGEGIPSGRRQLFKCTNRSSACKPLLIPTRAAIFFCHSVRAA